MYANQVPSSDTTREAKSRRNSFDEWRSVRFMGEDRRGRARARPLPGAWVLLGLLGDRAALVRREEAQEQRARLAIVQRRLADAPRARLTIVKCRHLFP